MTTKKFIALFCCATFIVVIACVTHSLMVRPGRQSVPGKSELAVADSLAPISAPFFVATANGYWDHEQLKVTSFDFTEAKFCFDAVLAGKAQIGNVAETPMTLAAMQGRQFKILATFVKSTKHVRCVGLRDHGIMTPEDLKGKKIALSVGTTGELYLSLFLKRYGLSPADTQVVNLKPPNIVQAMLSGQVDGAVTWEPQITTIRRQLKDAAIIFPAGNFYTTTSNLVCLPEFAANHAAEVICFLRSMQESIAYMKAHKEESIDTVAKKLQIDRKILEDIWDNYDFDLVLDDSIVRYMNDQSKWAISSGVSTPPSMPVDFAGFLEPAPLRSIDPKLVSLSPATIPAPK